MENNIRGRVAILYPGDVAVRREATPENNRHALVFQALTDAGMHAAPAVYHDSFCDVVREQLLRVDAVLVWVNPIQDGHDRRRLDAMLREVADRGVLVSAHPDVILKMGTKEVLYRTRHMGWGCDTHLYDSLETMRAQLPLRLACGAPRVLKQYRGNGGDGVWKVALATTAEVKSDAPLATLKTRLRVRHAKRGSIETEMDLGAFYKICEPYFSAGGKMIDQAYQTRLPEGMVRCYLVQGRVAGFGHQAVNALYPAPVGAPPTEAPQPGPRHYHPPDMAQFQALKRLVESQWVPEMQRVLAIDSDSLPLLWDCDFLLGPKTQTGKDTYVLCEINVSSVAPFPESALPSLAKATLARIQAMQSERP